MFKKFAIVFVGIFLFAGIYFFLSKPSTNLYIVPEKPEENYWFVLHRISNTEEMFFGVEGEKMKSRLVKNFKVKAGVPGERPTPLPSLVGREYWIIIKKESSAANPETAPYFITLDIPSPSVPPYGPVPYMECDGQCDWILPGAFGLHGVNGDSSRLDDLDSGSSGCIRHSDMDITYLYNLLEPDQGEIRYYVEDN